MAYGKPNIPQKTSSQKPAQALPQEERADDFSVRPKVLRPKKIGNAAGKEMRSLPQSNLVNLLIELNKNVDDGSIYNPSLMPSFIAKLEQITNPSVKLTENNYRALAELINKIDCTELFYKDFFKIFKLIYTSDIFTAPLPPAVKTATTDMLLDKLINGMLDFANDTYEIKNTLLLSECILVLSDIAHDQIEKSDKQNKKITLIFEKIAKRNINTLKKIHPFYFEKFIDFLSSTLNTIINGEDVKDVLRQLEPVIKDKVINFNPRNYNAKTLCRYFVNLDIVNTGPDFILGNEIFDILLDKIKKSDLKNLSLSVAKRFISSIGLMLKKSNFKLKETNLIENIIKQINIEDVSMSSSGSQFIKLFVALSNISKFMPEIVHNKDLNQLEQKVSIHLKRNLNTLNPHHQSIFHALNADLLNIQINSSVKEELRIPDLFKELTYLDPSLENTAELIEKLVCRNLLYNENLKKITRSFLKEHVPFIKAHFDEFNLATKICLIDLPPKLLQCDNALIELIKDTIDRLATDKELKENKELTFAYLNNIYANGDLISNFKQPLRVTEKHYANYKDLETKHLLLLALFFIQVILVTKSQARAAKSALKDGAAQSGSQDGAAQSTNYLKKRIKNIHAKIQENLKREKALNPHDTLKYNLISAFIDPEFSDDNVYFSTSESGFEMHLKLLFNQHPESASFIYKEEAIISGLSPVDLFFEKQKVICEINGQHHFFGEQKENKKTSTLIRDHILTSKGFHIYNIDVKEIKAGAFSDDVLKTHIDGLIAFLKEKDEEESKKRVKKKQTIQFN